jgi:D-alanine-D-alanine ligase
VRNIICAAREAWHIMGCTGYARVDMRVDVEGCPQVLEINCNPDLSPDACFHRSAQAGGHSYQSMSRSILDMALAVLGSPMRWRS